MPALTDLFALFRPAAAPAAAPGGSVSASSTGAGASTPANVSRRAARPEAAARTLRACAAAVCATGLAALSPALAAAQALDPALEQTVEPDEAVVSGQAHVIDSGHVDFGPMIDADGQLKLLARDDSGVEPVWRDLNDVIFEVSDAAQLTLPDDDAYSFTGAEPGETAWVLPQTEAAGVPWLGWNTQAPSLEGHVSTGVTLELVEHRGEGTHALFLQSGGVSAPEVLWTSKKPDGIFAELGTHTHANWTFTQPGYHELIVRASFDTPEGEHMSAEAPLRFAISADPAGWQEPTVTQQDGSGWLSWVRIGAAVVVGAIIVIVVVRRRG